MKKRADRLVPGDLVTFEWPTQLSQDEKWDPGDPPVLVISRPELDMSYRGVTFLSVDILVSKTGRSTTYMCMKGRSDETWPFVNVINLKSRVRHEESR